MAADHHSCQVHCITMVARTGLYEMVCSKFIITVSFVFCRYFFPTFENDSLLCALTDTEGSTSCDEVTSCAVTEVTAEDLPDVVSSFALK